MPPNNKPPRYRWVIEGLILLALFTQAVVWLAPAPILDPIIHSLNLTLGEAGLVISIVSLCISIFSFFGAFVVRRIGPLRAMLAGIWLMAFGQFLSGFAGTMGVLLGARAIEGIGFGLMIAPPGALVMEWFDGSAWPWINTVNALCSYVGITAMYAMTVPIFAALYGSWRGVMIVYGAGVGAIALLWSLTGRERHTAEADALVASALPAANNSVLDVLRMRDVALIALGTFGGMWVYQMYTAFLPQFFHVYRGLSLHDSSNLTAVLTLAGIFASAGAGFGTGLLGLRKPFTWPAAILMLLGGLGAMIFTSAAGTRLALILFGIGAASSPPAVTTLLMELPGMTPVRMGIGLSLVWSAGYAGAFVSPFLGGALAGTFGLRAVMLGFLVLQSLPIVAMYLVPETGPGRATTAVVRATGTG